MSAQDLLVLHLRGLLAGVLRRIGVIRPEVTPSGPELTVAAQTFLESESCGAERIVAVAIRMNKNALVISLPRPARHNNVLEAAVGLGMEIVGEHEQGFLTSDGRFVRRSPARRIAKAAGQLTGEPISRTFTSEELWQ